MKILYEKYTFNIVNIALIGNSRVGKSSFIKKYLAVDQTNKIKIQNNNNVLSSTTRVISAYQCESNILYDTKGIYETSLISYESCCRSLERTLREINQIDYIIFCIQATKRGI